MKLNWYLSLIFAGLLCPTAAIAQSLPNTEQSFFDVNSNEEITPIHRPSSEFLDKVEETPEFIAEKTLNISEEQLETEPEETVNIDKKRPQEKKPTEVNPTAETPETEAEVTNPTTPATEPEETVNIDKKRPQEKKPTEVNPATETPETEAEGSDSGTTETVNSCETSPSVARHPFASVEVAQKEEKEPSATTEEVVASEKPTETQETEEKEETETLAPTLSPEDINRYQAMAKGDHFYRCGDTLLAERFYRDVKEPFGEEAELNREMLAEAVYEAEYLLPGGSVYWRLYQESLEDSPIYKSKRLAPLKLLTEDYPEFIPGHIKYAEALEKDQRPEEAHKILTTAANLYPNEAPLVEAKIEADEEAKNWLAASLTARQFALFNQDHFRAEEFKQLADNNLARYQGDLQEQMTWNVVGNAVMGGIGAALMGNVFAPLSTLQTSYLLLRGESAIGESYADGFKNRLKMAEDEEVLAYVNELGQKLAKVAGRDEFEYEFYVVMDETVNAFALPGGKIFVHAGAIAKTESEAELAGLLAHELAHTVLSHGFQQMTQGALTSSVVDYIPYVGGLASNLLILNYSRDMEQQADLFGTRLLAATGYAADGLRNLMVIIDEEHKNRPPAWLSTHPDTSERVKYIEAEIVRNNFNRFAYEGVEKHQQMRKKVTEMLEAYKAEQNGEKPEEKPENTENQKESPTSEQPETE
ncbi:MAG: M48 family metalloprotease [Cyanobacteria bacterium P01_G01_bin.49]